MSTKTFRVCSFLGYFFQQKVGRWHSRNIATLITGRKCSISAGEEGALGGGNKVCTGHVLDEPEQEIRTRTTSLSLSLPLSVLVGLYPLFAMASLYFDYPHRLGTIQLLDCWRSYFTPTSLQLKLRQKISGATLNRAGRSVFINVQYYTVEKYVMLL